MEKQRPQGHTSFSNSHGAYSEPRITFSETQDAHSDSDPQSGNEDRSLSGSKSSAADSSSEPEETSVEPQGSYAQSEDAESDPQDASKEDRFSCSESVDPDTESSSSEQTCAETQTFCAETEDVESDPQDASQEDRFSCSKSVDPDTKSSFSEAEETWVGPQGAYSQAKDAGSDPQAAYKEHRVAGAELLAEDAQAKSLSSETEQTEDSNSETGDASSHAQVVSPEVYPGPSAGSLVMDSINLPVQNQPGCHLSNETVAIAEMPAPLCSWNCPPGLECLRKVNETLIHQRITFLSVIASSLKRNKYEIKNNLGQMIFFAVEDSSYSSRLCCGTARPFTLRIFNDMEQEVITLERPLRCNRCCFPCCLQELNVQAPPGEPIGYVIQIWHPRLPVFIIQNEKRKDVLSISGPCCLWNCCREVNFEIKSIDEDDVIGKISKQSSGFIKEFLVNAGNIAIQFPEDVSETVKALVLGACFLIDFIFFESRSYLQQFLFLRRIC